MSGVAGRSGRKKFVPTPDHRDLVTLLATRGIPQEYIRRLIRNPQTGRPVSIKTLERAFATEIKTAKVAFACQIARFIMDSILGRRSVNAKPIKDERLRVTLAIFVAKTRLGWTVPNRHHRVRSPIDAQESLERLDAKIARLAPDFKAGETDGSSVERIRRTIGEYNVAGQYQQAPAPLGGGLVKAAWFKRYREDELPARFDRIVQSWDTANKATELSDFSVCTTWGVRDKKVYLLGILRQRLEFPALKRAVREQQNLYRATEVLIEDKASGTQLIQELIADGCYGVTRYQPTTDKIMRMHAQTAMIENGFVQIPETAPWLAEYLHEISVFPKGKHDDQVDSTAQFLDWFKKPFPGQGILEFCRRDAEKLKPPKPVYVRIKAPPGIGAVQTFSGRHITIGEDRIVEMSEEDANCLIPVGWTLLTEPPGDASG
jgi:predicted phage terminase large subunit-like protein